MTDTPTPSIPEKDFEVGIIVTPPGETRAKTYKIHVKAYDNVSALRKATEKWKDLMEPKNIGHVKEIAPGVH